MNEEREAERILMNVGQTGRAVKTMFWIGNPATMLLITFLKRMMKQKLLKVGEYDKLEKFIAATKGEYNIANVPMEQGLSGFQDKSNISKELDELGVTFNILPDFNKQDGLMQIAVADKDKGKFSAWFSRNLMQNMKGGKHEIQDLKNLTEGHMNIVSVPFEGKEEALKEDFDRLGINYAVLPDLNVGDGELQCYVANVDLPKVEHWYGIYRDSCMKKGEEVDELRITTTENYVDMGSVSSEQYINMADDKAKAANALYEGNEPGVIESSVGNKMKTINDEKYDLLHKDPKYEEITINHDSLVERSVIAKNMDKENGFFASRIPGTWGETEQTLILSKENVFLTDGGKTYIGFMHKEKRPMVLDAAGKPVSVVNRLTGAELKAEYSKVERRFGQKQNLNATAEKHVEKVSKVLAEKSPTNPMKVR